MFCFSTAVHGDRNASPPRSPSVQPARLWFLRAGEQQHQRGQQQWPHLAAGDAEHRQQQRSRLHRQRERGAEPGQPRVGGRV